MIKGACINRAYSHGKNGPITHFFIRTKDNKYHVKSYIDKPYIYAKIVGSPSHTDITSTSKPKYITQCGEKVSKVCVKFPKSVSGYKQYNRNLKMSLDIPPVRDVPNFVKVFEDYIEFADRCAVDHGIKYGMWATSENIVENNMIGGMDTDIMPYIVTLDTEVRTYRYDPDTKKEAKSVDFPKVADAENEVLSIQNLDNQTEIIHFFRLHNDWNDLWDYANGDIKHIKNDLKEEFSTEVPFVLDERIKKLLDGRDSFIVKEYVYYSEKSMLEDWLDFIVEEDYDIIAAFNGMQFDFPYLISRMKRLKVNYNRLSPMGYVTARIIGTKVGGRYIDETDIRIPGRNLLDTRTLFMDKIFEKRAKNGLTDFSQDEINKSKIKHDEIKGMKGHYHSIDYEFIEQLDKFRKYACYDVILDYYLQKVLGIWDHFIKLAKSSGTQLFQITKGRKRVRQKTLAYAKEMGYVTERETFGSETFQGASVLRPSFVGKIPMAADLDVTSQYPSIIEAFNISWDTLVLDHTIFGDPKYAHIIDISTIIEQKIKYTITPIKGVYFRLDRIGLFPRMVSDTRSLRDDVKKKLSLLSSAEEDLKAGKSLNSDQKQILEDIGYRKDLGYLENQDLIQFVRRTLDNDQNVLKIDINSIYGNLPPFLAACVTAGARALIKFTILIINKYKYPSKYTDTDSVIFKTNRKTPKGALDLSNWLVKIINEGYKKFEKKYGCREGFLEIKSEEIYNPIIFVYNKSSKTGQAAAKKYVKCLVVDRGVILTEPKLEHKGILKKRQSSVFAVDMGNLLIYYIGMNYPNNIVINRAKALINKAVKGLEKADIPDDEITDMKKKKIKLHKGKYTLEELSFPVNIRKHFRDYKNLNYIHKGIMATNEWSYLWSPVSRKLGKGDTAFMMFMHPHKVDPKMPSELDVLPKNIVWSLNDDGNLHKDFKIDFDRHVERIISKYDVLLKAVEINPKIFLKDKNQTTLKIKR